MSEPFFSVIVPAHNASGHIRKLLDSVASQSSRDYELIVVCDNCTDDTEQIARGYGAVTESVSFGRDGLSRDRGIELASGTWILFADDDDWFLHEYVFQQIHDAIMNHAGTGIDVLAFGYIFRTKGYRPPFGQELYTPRVAHVWAKCWRRQAVIDAGAKFGDAVFSSDTYFLRAMREYCNGEAFPLNMPMYYYNFMRPGSQTDLFVHGKIRQSPVAE